MCGFAGLVAVNGGGVDRGIVERMTESLRHRGPDDEGVYLAGSVGLGFRRLSILDLSPAGHQPMESPDGRAVIVFNGEIFNYVELRRDLEARGHVFRSTGDTEVLLAAYREWGRDCLAKLNGMWAFLIFDRERGRIFGSRDRFGIKPLYWHRAGDTYLFASEIKAIRLSGLYQPEPDWETAAEFLVNTNRSAADHGEATFYAGVQQILPGTSFELDLQGGWSTSRYWSLADYPTEEMDDPSTEFAELFEDAVRLRLRSDVPVGVCLSGGLDSTAIICAMARQRQKAGASADEPLHSFCYHARQFDETRYVNDTLAQTGAVLNRIELCGAMDWDRLQQMMWFYDQPVYGVTALVGFELMQLAASKGVKVVQNGQGADEALAGYYDFFRQYWYTLLQQGRLGAVRREIEEYAAAHALDARTLRRWLRTFFVRTQLRRSRTYRWLAALRQRRAAARNPWYRGPVIEHYPRDVPPHVPATLRVGLERNVEVRPLPHELRAEDRNSMAHSVEARLPFMDYRLIALAFRIPDRWKIRGKWNKYILRESMRGRIPESIRTRVDKMGFPTQARDWFAGPWYEPMQDLLASREARERGIYRVENLRRDLEAHRRGEIDVSEPLLFNVAQMEFWFKANALDSVPQAGARTVPG
ncbi:MAG: asparagine synthase (glutamine-hydrolyzing) [Planctomycetota bacterium]|jgi:asparagine synthase (glutamine-hydrolysing)